WRRRRRRRRKRRRSGETRSRLSALLSRSLALLSHLWLSRVLCFFSPLSLSLSLSLSLFLSLCFSPPLFFSHSFSLPPLSFSHSFSNSLSLSFSLPHISELPPYPQ